MNEAHINIKLPDEIELPESWPFDLEWENKISETVGWNGVEKSCKVKGAGWEINNYLIWNGQRAFEKAVIQNQIIRKICSGRKAPETLDRSDVDWQSGNTWEKHLDVTERIFLVHGAAKAPVEILSAINYAKNFIHNGWQHSEKLIAFIEEKKKAFLLKKEQDFQQREISRNSQRNKWGQIDVDHSKVEAGFIYALKNALMPGHYKIGFTASNPDLRAGQISEQYGLPSPFLVVEYWRTKDPYIVEKRIHASLAAYRKGGEFFEIAFDDLSAAVHSHIKWDADEKEEK